MTLSHISLYICHFSQQSLIKHANQVELHVMRHVSALHHSALHVSDWSFI